MATTRIISAEIRQTGTETVTPNGKLRTVSFTQKHVNFQFIRTFRNRKRCGRVSKCKCTHI